MAPASHAANPQLYAGEILNSVSGHPTIYHYSPATLSATSTPPSPTSSHPLIVCITGGAHLARVFYGGHHGHAPQNFLAYWLNQLGHPVLSLSYPLETNPEIMPPTASSFRIGDWGKQAAATTRKVMDEYHLHDRITLISWSMGGRMVVPFNIAATSLGIDVRLYISFAATPGLSSIRPLPPGIECSENGYFGVPPLMSNFCGQVDEMRRLNGGREIISDEVYLREYTGKSPVNLIGLRLKYDQEAKRFVQDEISHEEDTGVLDVSNFPLIAGFVPESLLDASHALGDRASWGFLLTYKIESMIRSEDLQVIQKNGKWEELKQLVRTAPERLLMSVQGNHFFFLGETGARTVARDTARLIDEGEKFRRELHELLQPEA